MTVLVLDRDVREAERIHELLEDRGHSCLIARDVEEAEWLLRVARIDALALGIEVRGRPALDWLEELCARRPAVAARTVVLTTRLLEPDEVRRIQTCGAGFLQQPVGFEELEYAIHHGAPGSARLRDEERPSAGRRQRPMRTPRRKAKPEGTAD